MDPLRIYVVFDPAFKQGLKWVDWLTEAFGGLGMQRDERRYGVPVQWRSAAWGAPQKDLSDSSHPRRIALDQAARHCVLLLVDAGMTGFRAARWRTYVDALRRDMASRGDRDLLVPVLIGGDVAQLGSLPQAIRDVVPDLPDDQPACTRFLVQLLNALLVSRQPRELRATHVPGHGIFVSHAKRDGWITAMRIVETLTRIKGGSHPAFFLDVDSLVPGADYEQRFVEAIGTGSLLALVSDAYHGRPWCRWEVLTAKRLGRPIVVADLSNGRVERTLPYLGNVPSLRIPVASGKENEIPDEAIEQLTQALLAEALRFELWYEHAHARMESAGGCWRLVARPPELADMADAGQPASSDGRPDWIVYPDPPLGSEELDLLTRAFPAQRVRSLSQAMVRS